MLDDLEDEAHALLPTPTTVTSPRQRKYRRPINPTTAENEARGKVPCSKMIPVLSYFAVFLIGFVIGVGVITTSDNPFPSPRTGSHKSTAEDLPVFRPQHRPHLPAIPPKPEEEPVDKSINTHIDTDKDGELFPTRIGFEGPTSTGSEPFILATAPPSLSYPSLALPASLPLPLSNASSTIYTKWGNLSPWRTVASTSLGLGEVDRAIPAGCTLEGVHVLHRHGARYPTNYSTYGGPASFARKWAAKGLKVKKNSHLDWLNNWGFKLGEEVLTPLGRQQMFDFGVHLRMRYGGLLDKDRFQNTSQKSKNVPVWRTESQHRMLASSTNAALGFFGWPLDISDHTGKVGTGEKWRQVVMIESPGFNCSLSPYKACHATSWAMDVKSPSVKQHYPALAGLKANVTNTVKGTAKGKGRMVESWLLQGTGYMAEWAAIFLKDTVPRINAELLGGDLLDVEDVYSMMEMCAYETVALGYSNFCGLFTDEEWDGFEYALDLLMYHTSSFSSPYSVPFGAGYLSELHARLTHKKIPVHKLSTNSTLDDDERTFPLWERMYVDATHEVVVLYVITALNLETFDEELTGGLPATSLKKDRKFRASLLAPFGTNLQFQLLSCPSISSSSKSSDATHVRILINDGVVRPPPQCGSGKETNTGLCEVNKFIKHIGDVAEGVDWANVCGYGPGA